MTTETDRIEADLNESRHRLNDTLEAIGSKLSPGQMVDEVLGLAKGQAGQFTSNLGRQVRDNPIPAALVAAGIAWLFVSSRNRRQHQEQSAADWQSETHYRSIEEARWATPRMPNETDEAYNERVHMAYAKALNMKQKAGEAAHEFQRRVASAVDGAKHAATGARSRIGRAFTGAASAAGHQAQALGRRAADVRHGAENFYQESPLVTGAIVMALGALVGSVAPLSQPERETLRGVADTAAKTGADLAERGARMVEENVNRTEQTGTGPMGTPVH